jgi:hypothetical protein
MLTGNRKGFYWYTRGMFEYSVHRPGIKSCVVKFLIRIFFPFKNRESQRFNQSGTVRAPVVILRTIKRSVSALRSSTQNAKRLPCTCDMHKTLFISYGQEKI